MVTSRNTGVQKGGGFMSAFIGYSVNPTTKGPGRNILQGGRQELQSPASFAIFSPLFFLQLMVFAQLASSQQ